MRSLITCATPRMPAHGEHEVGLIAQCGVSVGVRNQLIDDRSCRRYRRSVSIQLGRRGR